MADGSIHIDTKLDSSGLESGLKNLGGIAAKGFAAVGSRTVCGWRICYQGWL